MKTVNQKLFFMLKKFYLQVRVLCQTKKPPRREMTKLLNLGNFLLGFAQIFDPIIALLMCAVWNDLVHLGRRLKVIVQLVLGLILLLSLLIPLEILL